MHSILKWFIPVFILLVVVAVYLVWNRPARNIQEEAPVVKIDADSLYKSYSLNEKDANKNYLDKAVMVSGIVGSVSKNADDKAVVFLKTNDPMFGVNCTMEEYVNVKEGDSIRLKGICTGFTTDVILIRCYINQ